MFGSVQGFIFAFGDIKWSFQLLNNCYSAYDHNNAGRAEEVVQEDWKN